MTVTLREKLTQDLAFQDAEIQRRAAELEQLKGARAYTAALLSALKPEVVARTDEPPGVGAVPEPAAIGPLEPPGGVVPAGMPRPTLAAV